MELAHIEKVQAKVDRLKVNAAAAAAILASLKDNTNIVVKLGPLF
ncbi:hypothetical protein [Adhaeribacter terreus]|uniref:Uncharacterized protein n=1 Tax=Adhaeribacter terreus TaxID=529703 RepID=A0ABW0EDZ5_9BACT